MKKPRIYGASLIFGDGGRSRARTYDPLIKSQLLYQLSYAPPNAGYRRKRRGFTKAFPACR
jgi:hypothetical protein